MIEIKNISKSFKDIKAVERVSLSVEKGEVFGLLGPNGAGKSTLISMICTLLKPDEGEIIIDGINIKKQPNRAKEILGLVPQDIALYPTLTAEENLKFWGKMYGLKGNQLRSRVEEALEIAGLQERAKGRIDTFSGGMKRRINIAAALLHKPQILIMDEPTVGIDPQSRNFILETILKLNKEGTTIIYTSHYMEEVEYLCNRIGIIDHGKIIALGSKSELKEIVGNLDTINIKVAHFKEELLDDINKIHEIDKVQYEEEHLTLVAKDGSRIIGKLVSMLEEAKCKTLSINIQKPDLEDVFLHLTGRALRD